MSIRIFIGRPTFIMFKTQTKSSDIIWCGLRFCFLGIDASQHYEKSDETGCNTSNNESYIHRWFKTTKTIAWKLVAGAGFEPTTFGLWARRATKLLHPASVVHHLRHDENLSFHFRKVERHTRFELVTSTLARLRSTNWASVAMSLLSTMRAIKLERHTRFELVTSTLARLRSTNWASVACHC